MHGVGQRAALVNKLRRVSVSRKATVLILRYAVWILLLFGGITLWAMIQLPSLQIDVSPRSLATTDDDSTLITDKFQQGTENMALIVIEDRELFTEESLRAVSSIIHELQGRPFVTRMKSLFNTPNPRMEGETVYMDPFIGRVDPTPEEIDRIIRDARANTLVHRNLLSDDGEMMVLTVELDAGELKHDNGYRIANEIENLLEPYQKNFDQLFQLGMHYIGQQASRSIQQDFLSLIPLSLVLLFAVLTLMFRSSILALLPILTSIISIIWLLGTMAFLGMPLTIMTSMVPVLIVIIGSTEDIHLIFEYLKGHGSGIGTGAAIRYMVRRLRLAIVLTFITTYLGFVAIGTSPIDMLREFGWVASTGLLVNFLVTVILLAVLLKLFGARMTRPKQGQYSGMALFEMLSNALSKLILKHKTKLFAISGVVLAASLSNGLNLNFNNNLLDYFADGSDVKQRIESLEGRMNGTENFIIVLDGRIEGTFNQRRYLDEISEIQTYIDASVFFHNSVSLVDYLVLLNRVMNDGHGNELPQDDEIIEGLTSLVDMKNMRSVVAEDFSSTAIIVRHGIAASEEVHRALVELKMFLDEHIDPALDITLVGSTISSDEAHQLMSQSMLTSLALMLGAILAVVSLLFSSYKAGLAATVANGFPIVLLFGVMGCCGIEVDAATSMIAVIALGICIDHTMHFMVCYRSALNLYRNPVWAVRCAMKHKLIPITTASLALFLGLGVLVLSGFEPIARFGMLSALVIVAAYFSNLVIMPALLLMRTPGQYAEAWLYSVIVRPIGGLLLLRRLAKNPLINANDY
ncbi:MAG: MMPL family transporter [Candidatus Thiodiazotropha endolucinida]